MRLYLFFKVTGLFCKELIRGVQYIMDFSSGNISGDKCFGGVWMWRWSFMKLSIILFDVKVDLLSNVLVKYFILIMYRYYWVLAYIPT